MKIVRFLGGLGNQMFQYAFYKSLQATFGSVKADLTAFDVYDLHNGFELEHVFPISLNKANPFLIKLYDPSFRAWPIRKLRRMMRLKNAFYEEKKWFEFDASVYTDLQSRLYWGYWQNENYFADIATGLREDLRFKLPLKRQNQTVYDQIKKSNSIAIHVRRGDYLHNDLLGGICDERYYQEAIKLIREQVSNPNFFIFSNDIEWCRSAFRLPQVTFVSWNHGQESYVDMQLMSSCKHIIIANSSFSWWSAWLNTHPDKIVISPAQWINDPLATSNNISLKEWIKL